MARSKRNRSRNASAEAPGADGKPEIIPRDPRWVDPTLTWYALWCRANQDRKAAQALGSAGLAWYRPLEARRVLVRGKTKTIEKSPVGRYLFAGLEPGRHFQAVRRALAPLDHGPLSLRVETRDGACTVSVRGFRAIPLADLIRTESGPLTVEAGLLQRFEDTIAAQGHPDGRRWPFRAGQRVRVVGGALEGLLARLESVSDDRVRGLADMFGRMTLVELEPEQLEAA